MIDFERIVFKGLYPFTEGVFKFFEDGLKPCLAWYAYVGEYANKTENISNYDLATLFAHGNRAALHIACRSVVHSFVLANKIQGTDFVDSELFIKDVTKTFLEVLHLEIKLQIKANKGKEN